jgi:hypothetical protein
MVMLNMTPTAATMLCFSLARSRVRAMERRRFIGC